MKKTIFTNPRWITGWLYALTFLTTFLFSVNDATAQCTLAANDMGYLSIDSQDCVSEITADMILESPQSCPGAIWQVRVYDYNGVPLHVPADNVVTSEQIGQTVMVQVTDLNSGNMTPFIPLLILDKMAPYWEECPIDTVDIYCYQEDNYQPVAYDACDTSNVTVIITSQNIKSNPCLENDDWTNDNVMRIVDRTFVAYDNSDNYSEECHVTLRVNTIPEDSLNNSLFLQFPINRTILGNNPISCSDNFESTVNGCCEETGCPTPEFSGVPFLRIFNEITTKFDTIELYPGGYIPCNMSASYVDWPENSSDQGCVKIFYRMWTVMQYSCDNNFFKTIIQKIEIADDNDPYVLMPANQTITTNTEAQFQNTSFGTINCGATFSFPVPEMGDACADQLEWDISVMNNYIPIEFINNCDPDNPPFRALPLGENTITYIVYDACGNSDQGTFIVSVVDYTAPVAICQQFTTVGLTYDGRADVFAHSFDSGSYDDCKLDYIEVKRMDDGAGCGLSTGDGDVFKDYVTFCCADIGEAVIVQFRVWDVAGNYNECMVEVTVQDKLPPVISCPDDLTVNCDVFYNTAFMGDYFGNATAYDNCEVEITEEAEFEIDQCGIGYVLRHFTATDPDGRTAFCTQRIDFVNNDPFYINQAFPEDPNDDINWPLTYQGTGCMNPADLHPDVTGWPELLEGSCDLAGATYNDDVFFFNDSNQDASESCFKIIRHWKVIDWCQKDMYNGSVYMSWYYDQVIMVSDPDGPTITSDCEDKTACTYDPDCLDGYIELTMSATDVCTDADELRWFYKIDYYNDNTYGSFDYESGVINGANVQALGEDNNGEFPIGTHRIYWTVWDQCGNKSTCDYDFTIMNCKQPTPYCLEHIATTLMDTGDGNGTITVVASDCAPCCLESYHACGYPVVVSFSADINDTLRTYTCDNLGYNEIQVWASALLPDGSITQDYCITKIEIQDNSGVCDGNNSGLVHIAGTISNLEGNPIAGTQVELEGSELAPLNTNEEGSYSFSTSGNGNYSVIPHKDGDDTEGVTTLDLILIQKHLLALKEIESPYTMIAADVDKNGKISAADLYTLRQLILGINETFSKTDSWTFVDGAYVFSNPQNPFNESFPSTFALNNPQMDMEVNFVGVKMGDINNTVGLDGGTDLLNRNMDALSLVMDEQTYNAGEIVSVPVYAENFDAINGFQLTLNFDVENLEFMEVEKGALNLGMNNLGFTHIQDGFINVSWSEANALNAQTENVLFTLYFNALNASAVSQDISLKNQLISAEAYNSDLKVIGVNLDIRNKIEVGFALFQNTPNPFSNTTSVSFNLPEAGPAILKITDVTGRLLKSVNGDFRKGINTIQVKKSELDASGVLYYQLDSEGHTATKKMVVIQ